MSTLLLNFFKMPLYTISTDVSGYIGSMTSILLYVGTTAIWGAQEAENYW